MNQSRGLLARWIVLLAAGCVVSSCNYPNPSPAGNQLSLTLTALQIISSPTTQSGVTPTNPAISPTVTIPPSTATLPLPTNTATATPAAPSSTPTEMTVRVFLIAVEDQGRSGPLVGCGDSAVAVTLHVPYTPGTLRAALTALLAIHDQYYGESGLYNALYQSRLTVGDVTIASGAAAIHLSGTLTLDGECDSPRVKAQLEQTALQFSTVHAVSIFVNDIPLENLLSGR